jgi:glycerol dehydrogenase-like iron-containing ADH family enzyme
MVNSMQLQDDLALAGCPVTPDALGLSPDTVHTALRFSRFSRDRLTWLDMMPFTDAA